MFITVPVHVLAVLRALLNFALVWAMWFATTSSLGDTKVSMTVGQPHDLHGRWPLVLGFSLVIAIITLLQPQGIEMPRTPVAAKAPPTPPQDD